MTKKKIYIAGKVTGVPVEEFTMKFGQIQKKLEEMGFEVVNPVELVQNFTIQNREFRNLSDSEFWNVAMKVCIKALLDCDGIYLMPCHADSKGAGVEKQLASDLGIPCANNIFTLTDLWKEPTP